MSIPPFSDSTTATVTDVTHLSPTLPIGKRDSHVILQSDSAVSAHDLRHVGVASSPILTPCSTSLLPSDSVFPPADATESVPYPLFPPPSPILCVSPPPPPDDALSTQDVDMECQPTAFLVPASDINDPGPIDVQTSPTGSNVLHSDSHRDNVFDTESSDDDSDCNSESDEPSATAAPARRTRSGGARGRKPFDDDDPLPFCGEPHADIITDFTMDYTLAMEPPTPSKHDAVVLDAVRVMVEDIEKRELPVEPAVIPGASPLPTAVQYMTHVITSDRPINEFINCGLSLRMCFPFLFLLGEGCNSTGAPSSAWTRQWLTLVDRRFAHASNFNFLLYDMSLRHEACRVVAAKLKADLRSFEQFIALANNNTLLSDVVVALQDPTTPPAQELLRKLEPIVRVSGRLIPYSPGARDHMVSVIKSYIHFFGAPMFFVTVAPADFNSMIVIRKAGPCDPHNVADLTREKVLAQFTVPNKDVRGETCAKDPAATSEFMGHLITKMFEVLFQCPLSTKRKHLPPALSDPSRREGLYGHTLAFAAVTEEQQRLALHVHALLWTKGGPGGISPADLEKALADPLQVAVMQATLDYMVTACIPDYEATMARINAEIAAKYNPPVPKRMSVVSRLVRSVVRVPSAGTLCIVFFIFAACVQPFHPRYVVSREQTLTFAVHVLQEHQEMQLLPTLLFL